MKHLLAVALLGLGLSLGGAGAGDAAPISSPGAFAAPQAQASAMTPVRGWWAVPLVVGGVLLYHDHHRHYYHHRHYHRHCYRRCYWHHGHRHCYRRCYWH